MFKIQSLFRFLTGQNFTLYVDSGGGGPSTTKSETSNIPEYARPYVETMLGAAQNEMFNYETDAEGNKTPTSLKGYTPFSKNVNDYFGGFQPLQEQAFGAAKNLDPSQQTLDASNLAAQAGARAMGVGYQGGQFGNQFQAPQDYQSGQFRADRIGTQSFTQPGAAEDYMSPYLEAAMNPQIAAAQRSSQMEGQKQQADAVSRGAYGGSRDALMRMERERNLGSQIEGIRSKGYQDAFVNAQSQFNADQARAMAAQQANQQTGLQAQQYGEQSRQFGAGQGLQAASLGAQYGQAANALNAQENQFGANLGLQGIQAANQAASTLGTLGQQQFGQEQAAIDMQNKLGTQQQQFEQAKKDQEIKDFANEQQWSMQQLGNMNSLLRGLPMQSSTTQSYQAAPSGTSQVVGGLTAAAGLASKAARGGSTKDIKKRKPGAGLAAGALNKVMKG